MGIFKIQLISDTLRDMPHKCVMLSLITLLFGRIINTDKRYHILLCLPWDVIRMFLNLKIKSVKILHFKCITDRSEKMARHIN